MHSSMLKFSHVGNPCTTGQVRKARETRRNVPEREGRLSAYLGHDPMIMVKMNDFSFLLPESMYAHDIYYHASLLSRLERCFTCVNSSSLCSLLRSMILHAHFANFDMEPERKKNRKLQGKQHYKGYNSNVKIGVIVLYCDFPSYVSLSAVCYLVLDGFVIFLIFILIAFSRQVSLRWNYSAGQH